MNIEQLTYIVEVAKSNSLAKAANTLHISQSALSQAITRLEEELNLKIFNRTRTGAIITKEGEIIIEKAKKAIHAIYEIKEEAHNQINDSDDLLRISTIPGISAPIIDSYLRFRKKESLLKIEVIEKGSMEIIEDVANNSTDFGFIALNNENLDTINDLEFTPLLNGSILIFASKESPLIDSSVVSIDNLKKQAFVLYKDKYVKKFINDFQGLYGPLNIVLTTTNVNTIDYAINNLGNVTIGHDISSIYYPSYLALRKMELNGSIDTSFRFGWIHRKDYKLSWRAKQFIEEINTILLQKSPIPR